jgi:hypothetical protein
MDCFAELEELLCEQAHNAFKELLFPGEIETHGRTNGPREWDVLPNNYQKALNLGFGVSTNDSTQVYKRAQSLLDLPSRHERLFAEEARMRSNIAKIVKVLEGESVEEVAEEIEKYLRITQEQPCIDRQTVEVVRTCFKQLDYDLDNLIFQHCVRAPVEPPPPQNN